MTRSDHRPHWQPFALALVAALAACARDVTPDDFAPGADAQVDRARQTRRFDGVTEQQLLAASVSVLQDLGFTVNRSNAALGLVLAVKTREAKAPDQKALLITMMFIAAMGGSAPQTGPIHEDQTISATVTIRPVPGTDSKSQFVRVTFHRLVRQPLVMDAGILRNAELYDAFGELLSKAIFLEEHKL